jgi:serine/threonine-protein kinase HipA
VAIVVKRYDRALNADGEVERIHQEDACQALSISPYRKYEADGGPGAREIIDLLLLEASNPDRDVGLFWDALALNWVILGADAHAKNYSILINSKSIELAPLYDLISLLPYPQHDSPRRLELAMRVDREYQIWKVRARHWEELARKCGLDVEPAVKRIQQLLRAIPGAVQAVVADLQATDLEDGILETLPGQVIDRAIECLTFFDVQRSDHPASRPNRGTSSSK